MLEYDKDFVCLPEIDKLLSCLNLVNHMCNPVNTKYLLITMFFAIHLLQCIYLACKVLNLGCNPRSLLQGYTQLREIHVRLFDVMFKMAKWLPLLFIFQQSTFCSCMLRQRGKMANGAPQFHSIAS